MGADKEVIGGLGLQQHVERFHKRGATAAHTNTGTNGNPMILKRRIQWMRTKNSNESEDLCAMGVADAKALKNDEEN